MPSLTEPSHCLLLLVFPKDPEVNEPSRRFGVKQGSFQELLFKTLLFLLTTGRSPWLHPVDIYIEKWKCKVPLCFGSQQSLDFVMVDASVTGLEMTQAKEHTLERKGKIPKALSFKRDTLFVVMVIFALFGAPEVTVGARPSRFIDKKWIPRYNAEAA